MYFNIKKLGKKFIINYLFIKKSFRKANLI
jgi:hypothetical protein